MFRSANTLPFVLATLERFESAKLPVWLFGGWAEEVWRIYASRAHHDIDLLYVAPTFDMLDHYIEISAAAEIRAKRYSHKRAVLHQGVMIECILVEPHIQGHRTRFFGNLYEMIWPRDLLDYQLAIHTSVVPVACKAALELYRRHHTHVEAAYRTHNSEFV